MKGKFTSTLTNFSVLLFLPLLMPTYKLVHVWPQLDNEVSTWFPNLHRIEMTCEFLLLIYHRTTKQIDYRLQTSLIWKKKKKSNMWKVVARRCSANKLSYKFHKIRREIPVLESLSNTVMGWMRSGRRASNYIKERPPHWCFRTSRS